MKSNRKRSNVGVALLAATEQRHAVRERRKANWQKDQSVLDENWEFLPHEFTNDHAVGKHPTLRNRLKGESNGK
jgi:hypothetical protein